MLQRLQTIFLLIIVMAMFTMSFAPIWTKIDTATRYTYTMYAWRFQALNPVDSLSYNVFMPYVFIGVLSVIAILIALYELFRYDNRMMQLKLGVLNSLVMTGVIGFMVYLAMQNETQVLPGIAGQYKLGFLLPAIAIISNFIANRLIKRDEKLARSVDRIR